MRQLSGVCLKHDLREYPVLAKLVEEERRKWDRRFDDLKRRYKDFVQIELEKLPSWQDIEHAREFRNALVRNLGLYTAPYLKTSLARRPVREHWEFHLPDTDENLVDNEPIPLDLELSEKVIADLLGAAKEVNDALQAIK